MRLSVGLLLGHQMFSNFVPTVGSLEQRLKIFGCRRALSSVLCAGLGYVITQVAGYEILDFFASVDSCDRHHKLTVALRATVNFDLIKNPSTRFFNVISLTYSMKACCRGNEKMNASTFSKNPWKVQA